MTLVEPLEQVCTLLLTGATRSRLYGGGHRLTRQAVDQLAAGVERLLAAGDLRLMVSGDELLAQERRLDATTGPAAALVRRLQEKGIGVLHFLPGVRRSELETFCAELADPRGMVHAQPHLRIGAVAVAAAAAPAVPEALRVQRPEARRDDPVPDEARQVQRLTGLLRDSYEVRTRDFRDVALSLLTHLTHQGSVFLNLAEVREHSLFTYLHTCNVATLGMGFGLSLGMSGRQAFELGTAALLHDVGKTFVPVEVLDKPGKLDAAEWELIRRHPVDGARLLAKQADVPRLAVVVAYEHHMHYHGSGGYPTSAFGPSPQAQLVAIADTFDALFGKRNYHARYDVLQALEILQAESGRVYNPELVDEFSRFVVAQLELADMPPLSVE
jgi:HD-GYP domain-containing protein (c-di-GMP phosphodiesterase class II)